LPSKKQKKKPTAKKAKPAKAAGSGQEATLVCAECSNNFTTKIALNNFDKEVGKKFPCPKCGAVYELISLLEGRITVTILAKGETRTYGKTYDITAKDYARPM
jgi:ribosomal protein L33